MPRVIAMIPTYNEAENIGPLLDAILALGPSYEALVVDDDSPDETWRMVLERGQHEPRVHLLRRSRNRGRGLAGIAGFREALRLGADVVVEMDGDWSHDPKWIPSLVAELHHADVAVASRLIRGGGEEGRPRSRRLLTHAANFYIRTMLRLPVLDATSGLRAFSRACLEALPWDAMQATGPEVVQEVLLAAHARGFAIVEVPYTFVERRHGQSTFNRRIMLRSLRAMARLRWRPGRIVPSKRGRSAGQAGQAKPDASEHHSAANSGDDQALIPLPAPLLVPLSWLYDLGRRTHRALALAGLRPRRRLPVPVVCVGNLTVGGTGKTPFVQLLSESLKSINLQPVILSRGYGTTERIDKPVIVGDGHRALASADTAGDEPLLLAQHCPGVPVISCVNRYEGGLTALREFSPDVLILDDGFQHDTLRRELDIVLWDLSDIPSRMRLLPAGRLREGLDALARAKGIVLTHAEYLSHDALHHRRAHVVRQLKQIAPRVPIFDVETRLSGFTRLSGRLPGKWAGASGRENNVNDHEHESAYEGEHEHENDGTHGHKHAATRTEFPWRGKRVIAVSGIARPHGFEAMLRASGADVCRHFIYPDHYIYDTWLFDDWRGALAREGAEMILTTAKDAVKLAPLPLFGLTVLATSISMRMTEPRRWELFLRDGLTTPVVPARVRATQPEFAANPILTLRNEAVPS